MKKLLIPILLLLFLIPGAFALNTYEYHYYTESTSNPAIIYGVPFKSTVSNCTLTLSVAADLTGSSSAYSIITDFYSPISTKIGTAYRAVSGNYTCLGQGEVDKGPSSIFDSKSIITRSGGYSSTGILDVGVECGTSDDWINISMGHNEWNSMGNSYNSFFQHGCIVGPYVDNFFLTTTSHNSCNGLANSHINPANWTSENCGGGSTPRIAWAMPFKTGDSGQIEYTVNIHAGVYAPYYGYYKPSDPSGTYVSVVSLGTSSKLTLEPNTDYVFYIGGESLGAGLTVKTVDLNISINIFTPDWECSEWSDCELGQQYRACIDPSGKIPAKIEYQGCVSEALATANLGFEKSFMPVPLGGYPLQVCAKLFWPVCYDGVQNITTYELPTDWSVINPNNYYFMDMSLEQHTEGTRSLKMWYWPPGIFPLPNGTCQFSDIGAIPQVYRGISNNTMFIEYNITFPSPYMTIDYDIKKCNEPVVQYDGWCGKACFQAGGNCTLEPKGNYYFALVDTVTGVLTNYYGLASDRWNTIHVDISDLGLIPGRTYNIAFAVNAQNLYEPVSSCVYFDNVNVAIRSAELPCDEASCVGVDLYTPQNVNGTCYYEISYNDLSCLDEEDQKKAINYESYCVDFDLYTYDNDSGEWLKTTNSTICIAEQEEKENEQSNTEPIAILGDIQGFLDGFGLGFLALFFSPIVISLFIAIGITAFVLIKVGDKIKSDYLGIVIFLSILSVESMVGIFPLWLDIILIVIAGLGLAWTQTKGG